MKTYNVLVISDEFGGEEFGGYDSLPKAYRAISRLSTSAARLNDNVFREYHIREASNPSTMEGNMAP